MVPATPDPYVATGASSVAGTRLIRKPSRDSALAREKLPIEPYKKRSPASGSTSSGEYTTKWEKCKSSLVAGCMTVAARSHEIVVGLSIGLAHRPKNRVFYPENAVPCCSRRHAPPVAVGFNRQLPAKAFIAGPRPVGQPAPEGL
jgi:hypothetical protein